MSDYYYHSLSDDLVKSPHQAFKLPDDYTLFPQTVFQKKWRQFVRWGASQFIKGYDHFYLEVQIIGQEKLVAYQDKGYFVYANHTQPLNDALMPLNLFGRQDYYALADQANWGIPIIGKCLARYGALPVGQNLKESARLIQGISQAITQHKHLVIYPEAHVWPYYTQIRPFSLTSLHFPVKFNVSSFVMTTTYQKPRHGQRPHLLVYIDGPFFPETQLSPKARQKKLHAQVEATLKKRAQMNHFEYDHYHRQPFNA